jgi:hypothetical protein
VVDRDGLDVVPTLEQRIDELDVAVPAQSEDVGHLLADEVVDDDLSAVEHVLHVMILLGDGRRTTDGG